MRTPLSLCLSHSSLSGSHQNNCLKAQFTKPLLWSVVAQLGFVDICWGLMRCLTCDVNREQTPGLQHLHWRAYGVDTRAMLDTAEVIYSCSCFSKYFWCWKKTGAFDVLVLNLLRCLLSQNNLLHPIAQKWKNIMIIIHNSLRRSSSAKVLSLWLQKPAKAKLLFFSFFLSFIHFLSKLLCLIVGAVQWYHVL